MLNVLTTDCETTTWNKGHPYDHRNKLVTCGFLFNDEYVETTNYKTINELFQESDLIVGHNLKFDLSWYRKWFGLIVSDKQPWDTQLAHFIITCQEHTYPSLNDVLDYYGLEKKLDVVKTEYWDKGIQTDEIPKEILSEYQEWDIQQTRKVYDKQKNHEKARLIRQVSYDMLALVEMEFNGMQYDLLGSKTAGESMRCRVSELDQRLNSTIGAIINWDSPKQVSAVLYGGAIEIESKEEYLFTYKDAKKPPTTKVRKVTKTIDYPRLVEPPKEAKEGSQYSVADGILGALKATGRAKKIIDIIKERSKMTKLMGTYFLGIPQRYDDKGWTGGIIHPNLNQTSVITGRLSSSAPNVQNITADVKQFFISRFP